MLEASLEERQTWITVPVSLTDALKRGQTALGRYRLQAACLALIMAGLASVDLITATPLFGSAVGSPFIQFMLQTNELLALAMSLYAAYKWDTALGMGAILLFLVLLVPSFVPDFLGSFPRLFHLQLVALISLFGIWLIGELRRTVKKMEQREREISAMAGLNAQVFNERAALMETAARDRRQLAKLLESVSAATPVGRQVEVAGTLLRQVRDMTEVEHATLIIIRTDGSWAERVDCYKGLDSYTIVNRPADLDRLVMEKRAAQYLEDTRDAAWSNPSLVKAGILSCLGLPVKMDNRIVGVLSLYAARRNAFQDEKQFLESLSGLLAAPLMRAEFRTDIGQLIENTEPHLHTPLVMRQ